MITTLKIWIVCALCSTMCVSCQQQKAEPSNYVQDPTISSSSGIPTDSLAYFVPTSIRKDTQTVILDIDAASLDQFSTGLYYAKEPILYNYYLGHDIYRFSLLRGFKTPFYFILHKDGDKVWLTTIGLDRRPNLSAPANKFVGDWKSGGWVLDLHDEFGDTIIKNAKGTYTRRANVSYNKTIPLTSKDWDEFEALLKECNYWNMIPFDTEDHLSNERRLIEAHLKNKYWFVHMYSPEGVFKNAGDFLIQKSGVADDPVFKKK